LGAGYVSDALLARFAHNFKQQGPGAYPFLLQDTSGGYSFVGGGNGLMMAYDSYELLRQLADFQGNTDSLIDVYGTMIEGIYAQASL
jgi:hypothetical protein